MLDVAEHFEGLRHMANVKEGEAMEKRQEDGSVRLTGGSQLKENPQAVSPLCLVEGKCHALRREQPRFGFHHPPKIKKQIETAAIAGDILSMFLQVAQGMLQLHQVSIVRKRFCGVGQP